MPMYGVEAYIGRAIESVQQQTFTNWELLIVNDGSKDRSREVAAEYERQDERIKIIDKPNGGLTSARLKGFECSTGKYLVFIDSDDSLQPSYLETLIANIQKYDADICMCSYNTINNRNVKANTLCFLQKTTILEGEDNIFQNYFLLQIPSYRRNTKFLPSFMWLRLFKREVIVDDLFVSERKVLLEDLAFSARLFKRLNRVVVIDEPLYNYYVNNGSLTMKYRENVWGMMKELIAEVNNVLEGHPKKYIEERVVGQCLTAMQFSLLNASRLDFKSFQSEYYNIRKEKSKVWRCMPLWGIKHGFVVMIISLWVRCPYILYKYNRKKIL